MFRKLFGREPPKENIFQQFEKDVQETIGSLDLDDPAVRTGVSLYFVLSKQFGLIGKPEGEFPYVPPFSSDKARGALLGTAIAVARREHGGTPHKAIIDAAITAFTLTFGADEGRQRALQTIEDAGRGNDVINDAADWAIKDTDGSIADESPGTPAAYYLAVSDMI